MKSIRVIASLVLLLVGCESTRQVFKEMAKPADVSQAEMPTVPLVITLTVRDAKETSLALLEKGLATKEQPLLYKGDPTNSYVAFEVDVDQEGSYTLSATYATRESRPFDVYVNGMKVLDSVGARTTGGWGVKHVDEIPLGEVGLHTGSNIVVLRSAGKNRLPCLAGIRLER